MNVTEWHELCARFEAAWRDHSDSQVLGSILREQADWIAVNVELDLPVHVEAGLDDSAEVESLTGLLGASMERDRDARAEVSRLRGVVEAVQALADEWERMEHRIGAYPEESAYNDGREDQAEACADAVRDLLAPVSSSGEARHTRTSTGGFGPDYCAECSEAAQEWVKWPCPASSGEAESGEESGWTDSERARCHDALCATPCLSCATPAPVSSGGQADEEDLAEHPVCNAVHCGCKACRMHLAARPVLSREALLLALARADGQTWTSLVEATEHTAEVMYGAQADAVLALLAGGEQA